MTTRFVAHRDQLFLACILITGFILRIWAIDFGLPHIYHSDEWFEVKRALQLGAGSFDLARVTKGGYFYVLFLEYGIYYVILRMLGFVQSGDDFLLMLFQDPTNIWLIGRITTAVIGTLNCYFIYLLGKHVYSKKAGLVAALLLSFHQIHVQSSHTITVDVPLTCLITICFFSMCRTSYKLTYSKYDYCVLGFLVAFATMTKITAAVILFPVAFFHYRNLKCESGAVKIKS